MAGTSEEDGVEIVFLNKPIHVNVAETESRARAPVAQKAQLDMFWFQGFTQQGIFAEVNHPGGKVVAGSPIRIELAKLVRRERFGRNGMRRLPWRGCFNCR
jgi:hypothetical protein